MAELYKKFNEAHQPYTNIEEPDTISDTKQHMKYADVQTHKYVPKEYVQENKATLGPIF